jgi:hydroxymethylbilane synthase
MLVVGGGPVAERKVRGLLEAGAVVTLVSPQATGDLARRAAAGEITWLARPFAPGDAAGCTLVFAATDDPAVNAAVVADAHAHGALANDAGEVEGGDFSTPAVHRSGPLLVTVDSSGLTPGFTKRIRDEIALTLDARYARAATTLGAIRERVQMVVPQEQRAAVLRHFAERDIDELAAMLPGVIEHEVERTADTLARVVPVAPRTLVCATRGSALALTQTRTIMARLAQSGTASTILTITTKGDAVQDRSIAALGTDSVFVKELELALREHRADYAVHSCKDLPSTLPDDMVLAAITVREDARDAFCSERYATFADLPPGARVGTSSPRRRAQLQALRADLVYDDIRGNVDTRLRKLRDGAYDAIVLAAAGMRRLGVRATHTVPFAITELIPAVGQGALAIETRAGDALAETLAALLQDPDQSIAVRAERAFLRTLRGGCQAPVGAHATYTDSAFFITGVIAALDGTSVVRGDRHAHVRSVGEAEAIASELATDLLARGGEAILSRAVPHAPPGPLHGRVFLLPRTQERESRIASALRDAGAEVIEAPDSATAHMALGARIPTALLFPSSGSVLAVHEYLTGLRTRGQHPLVATMGPASSESAGAHGFPPDVVAPSAEISAFVHTVTRFVLENGT